MKAIIAFCIVILSVNAQAGYNNLYLDEPLFQKKNIPIVRLVGTNNNYGNYNFDSEGADGTKFAEVGSLKGTKSGIATVKSGEFSWTSPEGQTFHLSYTSDEFGFHPVASHLPTPPPIPAEIARMLPLLPKLSQKELEESYAGYTAPISIPHNDKPQLSIHKPSHQVNRPHKPALASKPELITNFDKPIVSILHGQLDTPLKTHVETPEFTIHSEPSKTFVRIGKL